MRMPPEVALAPDLDVVCELDLPLFTARELERVEIVTGTVATAG
jgi:hypothetical protein